MPDLTYPPIPPVLTGDVETISRFLNTPTFVPRALRTLTEQRFIGDVLLSGRVTPQGGAVLYEQNESIFADRTDLDPIHAGMEFPISTVGRGVAQIASVLKRGLDSFVTLEDVQRLNFSPVDRALTKLANSVIRNVDGVVLTAITAAPTQTLAATASWSGAGAKILLDLLTAVAKINNQNQGYNADTLVLDDFHYATMMNDQTVQTAMRRETVDNPIYSGHMGRIAGLDVMVTNNGPNSAVGFVLDRSLLGAIADERPLTSGSWWLPETEKWRLRALRTMVPMVIEPNACVQLTGI
jgi:hypothetical protein